MYLLLALASGVLFGVWKFGLGRYRGSVSAYSVVFVSAIGATLVYLVTGLATGEMVFNRGDLGPGLLGGTLNLIGNLMIVLAFQRGKLGVVSGIALVDALVPMTYSLIIGEPLAAAAAVGVVLVLVGLFLFYVPDMRSTSQERTQPIAIVYALVAALAWGVAVIVMDAGTRVSLTATLLLSEIPQVLFTLFFIAVVTRSWGGLSRRAVAVLAGAGLALGVANLIFFVAANEGDIGVVSVLGSISPIVVALMALVLLKEKMLRSEIIAMGVVLLGTAFVVF